MSLQGFIIAVLRILETVVPFHFSGGKVYSLNKVWHTCMVKHKCMTFYAITTLFNISYLARCVYIHAWKPFLTPYKGSWENA